MVALTVEFWPAAMEIEKKEQLSWYLTRSPKAFLWIHANASAMFIQMRVIRFQYGCCCFFPFRTNFILMSFLWPVKWYRFNLTITCILARNHFSSDLKSIYCCFFFLLITNDLAHSSRDTIRLICDLLNIHSVEGSINVNTCCVWKSKHLCNGSTGNNWANFVASKSEWHVIRWTLFEIDREMARSIYSIKIWAFHIKHAPIFIWHVSYIHVSTPWTAKVSLNSDIFSMEKR